MAGLLAAALCAAVAHAADTTIEDLSRYVFEPDGYRMDHYRAPTPATISGGTTVSTPEVEALAAAGEVVLIDVMPAPRRPKKRPAGRLWLPEARHHIPGSVWLPNTGYGELSSEFEAYFRDHLDRLSGGDRAAKLVFYCEARCWMSWNAAKRAIGLGYRNVYWYPDGSDGWRAAGLPLIEATPVPMPDFVAPPAAPVTAPAAP
jgi:PQQ-dependent catabolism-associated CXXCW motif protein